MKGDWPLCACGCGEPVPAAQRTQRGVKRGDPLKFVLGHSRRVPNFWTYEDRGHDTPCHIWQGAKNSRGYGVRNSKLMHRVRYEAEVGPIPEGLQLDHRCDVRICCNPAHVEPVTGAENRRRGKDVKLSMEIAEEIRNSPLSSHKLARIYNVSAPTIQAVRNGESWKHP